MKKFSFVLLILLNSLSITCSKEGSDLKARLESLSGKYSDPKPYIYGKAFGKRVFTFDKGKWTLVFTLALDPEMKKQVFDFRTYGNFIIQDKSNIPNTYKALFIEDKKFITLKTENKDLIQAFGFMDCNLEIGIEKDISEKGCSLWRPISECASDYDLLSLDDSGKLYFGERPQDNNMCTEDKRPTKLTPAVVLE